MLQHPKHTFVTPMRPQHRDTTLCYTNWTGLGKAAPRQNSCIYWQLPDNRQLLSPPAAWQRFKIWYFRVDPRCGRAIAVPGLTGYHTLHGSRDRGGLGSYRVLLDSSHACIACERDHNLVAPPVTVAAATLLSSKGYWQQDGPIQNAFTRRSSCAH